MQLFHGTIHSLSTEIENSGTIAHLVAGGVERILVRILRNLRNSYTQSYAYTKAMRCTDMALGLEPNSPEDIRDKGFLEEKLLNYDSALKLLNQYLEINPNAEDVDFILEHIRYVRNKISQ